MNNRFPYFPIFGITRGPLVEVEIFGVYCALYNNTLLTPQTADTKMLSRSLLKPWQLANCIDELDDKPEWAMGMSSSSAENVHLQALTALAQFTNINTEELICPPAYSYHLQTELNLPVNKEPPCKINHFCCGNHLAIKYTCEKLNWDPSNYFSQENPFHNSLSKYLYNITHHFPEWTTDSCGLPTLIAPMKVFLKLWNNLNTNTDNKLQKVKQLWLDNPILIGGTNRVDTRIIQWGEGKVLAKEGADGLIAIQTLEDPKNNFTFLIKLSQRASDEYLAAAVYCVLQKYRDLLPNSLLTILINLKSLQQNWLLSNQALINLLI